jgi:hypothetical protein
MVRHVDLNQNYKNPNTQGLYEISTFSCKPPNLELKAVAVHRLQITLFVES